MTSYKKYSSNLFNNKLNKRMIKSKNKDNLMEDIKIMTIGILKTMGQVTNWRKVIFKIYHFINKDKKQKMKNIKQTSR